MPDSDATKVVLIIEDDENDYLLMKELVDAVNELSDIEYQVEWRDSYESAAEYLEGGRPWCFLIADYHLPEGSEKSGLNLIRLCRERGIATPAILVSQSELVDVPSDLIGYIIRNNITYLPKGQLTRDTLFSLLLKC